VLTSLDTQSALALLAQLPPDQAEVVLLRVLSGIETTRVATIVGKRPGTVRVLQHRALHRLAELVAAHAPAEEARGCGRGPRVRSSSS
jgi:RNA polymerase sigma-70 factor (ECF subfamily)